MAGYEDVINGGSGGGNVTDPWVGTAKHYHGRARTGMELQGLVCFEIAEVDQLEVWFVENKIDEGWSRWVMG